MTDYIVTNTSGDSSDGSLIYGMMQAIASGTKDFTIEFSSAVDTITLLETPPPMQRGLRIYGSQSNMPTIKNGSGVATMFQGDGSQELKFIQLKKQANTAGVPICDNCIIDSCGFDSTSTDLEAPLSKCKLRNMSISYTGSSSIGIDCDLDNVIVKSYSTSKTVPNFIADSEVCNIKDSKAGSMSGRWNVSGHCVGGYSSNTESAFDMTINLGSGAFAAKDSTLAKLTNTSHNVSVIYYGANIKDIEATLEGTTIIPTITKQYTNREVLLEASRGEDFATYVILGNDKEQRTTPFKTSFCLRGWDGNKFLSCYVENSSSEHILTELFGSGLEDIASIALDIPGAYEVDL